MSRGPIVLEFLIPDASPVAPVIPETSDDSPLDQLKFFPEVEHTDIAGEPLPDGRIALRVAEVRNGQTVDSRMEAPVGILIRDRRENAETPLSYVNLMGQRVTLDERQPYPFVVDTWLKYVQTNCEQAGVPFEDPRAAAVAAEQAPTSENQWKARASRVIHAIGRFFVRPMLTEEAPDYAHEPLAEAEAQIPEDNWEMALVAPAEPARHAEAKPDTGARAQSAAIPLRLSATVQLHATTDRIPAPEVPPAVNEPSQPAAQNHLRAVDPIETKPVTEEDRFAEQRNDGLRLVSGVLRLEGINMSGLITETSRAEVEETVAALSAKLLRDIKAADINAFAAASAAKKYAAVRAFWEAYAFGDVFAA
jgi:hypothetical protein